MEIELICDVCGKSFLRSRGEANRNKKLGRRTYCSLECVGKGNLDNIPIDKRHHPENLVSNNRGDEFSPFRWHFRNAKRRNKSFDLTLKDLKEQWELQKGRCPYTGWELRNLKDTHYHSQLPKSPDRASLDRIDSSKGYIKDNIQFVSMMAQFAKNGWDQQELLVFCEAVVQNRLNKHG